MLWIRRVTITLHNNSENDRQSCFIILDVKVKDGYHCEELIDKLRVYDIKPRLSKPFTLKHFDRSLEV
jgi:hypothetical protein